jgi:transposase
MLAERIEIYEKLKDNRRALFDYKYKDEIQLKKEYPWMKEVSKFVIQSARLDLQAAYSNFFASLKNVRKGQKMGFPKFKKKGQKDSYREYLTNNNIAVIIEKRKVKLPKLGLVSFRNNKIFIEADKWFASSKTCSLCGFKKDLLLQEREWDCPNCGKHHDRDHNAGINLKNYSLKQLGLGQPEVKLTEKQAATLEESTEQAASVKQEAPQSLVAG